MPLRYYVDYENYKQPAVFPAITRSPNQTPSREYYHTPPITLPNPTQPILPQLDNFLTSQATPPRRYGEPLYGGPYGKLGTTDDPAIIEMKQYLAELPPTISLEARSVLLTTLLNRYNPMVLGSKNHLPPLYDHNRDRHLAQHIYGGNGLYRATEEWVGLAKGKLPGNPQQIKLPWLTMHIRHTFLNNPHLIDRSSDVQTAVDIIMFLERHFRQPHESQTDYIDRLSELYWDAQEQLRRANLLPAYEKDTLEPVRIYIH